MPTKKVVKKAAKRKVRKVQVVLPESLVRALDREVRRSRQSGKESSRASLMKELLGLGVIRRTAADPMDAASMADARDALLGEAVPLAREAALHEASGGRPTAARLYLAAAARELEAISFMSPDDEAGIKSALIMAVHHAKKGTGYRHLPDVTVTAHVAETVQ
jgi:hypothetical protein